MKRLKMPPDGKANADAGVEVKATSLGWYYALVLEYLQAQPFPYDWRVSVCDTADRLAEFIDKKYSDGTFDADKPVHFVAHSMGGLVVRNFVRQHKELWNKNTEPQSKVWNRLVMLGTPNDGSFAAVQTLMGKNSFVRKIAAIPPFQSKAEWFQITNTFPSLYRLCPTERLHPEVYKKSMWDKFPYVRNVPHRSRGR